ncbi:MAG: hypothetical protein V2I47_00485 [Bacteroidales bacterium]|jgi:hypothetical protein|nr:hypothetical protein [Bacteroidales bacterium]
MKKVVIILIAIASVAALSCSNQNKKSSSEPIVTTGITVSGPDAIIYKTRGDYKLLVPVIMNDEKTEIASFPAPGDLKYKGKPSFPTELENGYLLDNRGITRNVAFTSYSYEEYMALEKTPSKEDLLTRIVDQDPLTEMYNCGKRAAYQDEVVELNRIIQEGDFSNFRKLK